MQRFSRPAELELGNVGRREEKIEEETEGRRKHSREVRFSSILSERRGPFTFDHRLSTFISGPRVYTPPPTSVRFANTARPTLVFPHCLFILPRLFPTAPRAFADRLYIWNELAESRWSTRELLAMPRCGSNRSSWGTFHVFLLLFRVGLCHGKWAFLFG